VHKLIQTHTITDLSVYATFCTGITTTMYPLLPLTVNILSVGS
jgi:hypothetical protein